METRALHLILIPLLLSPLAATPETAAAQGIRRCNGPDGTTIFTDRSCASFGATLAKEMGFDSSGSSSSELREPPANLGRNGAVGNGFAMRGCAQSQGELIAGVRGAIESGDVNRLSNYYHWTGTSTATAFALLERLDKIARNTLSGVQFDYPYAQSFDYATAAAAIESAPQIERAVPMPVEQVVYTAGPSYMDRYRPENDDTQILATGIVDAATPLEDVLPEMRARAVAAEADAEADAAIVSGGTVDASTLLVDARAMTLANVSGGLPGYGESSANPQPVALRVNNGGGSGTRFSLRQNAGCWFIQF